MPVTRPIESDIVLLGAGHAHLEVLRRFAMQPEGGVRLTIVAREPEMPYARMLPGLLRGDYTHGETHVDLAPLTAAAGARLILAEATGIDLAAREVSVPGRPSIGFDLLSVDLGNRPVVPENDGIALEPLGQFLDCLAGLRTELAPRARIAVVGAGAAATELALALSAQLAGAFRLALVCEAPDPVPTAPPSARRAVRDALVEADVELACGVAAGSLAGGRLALSDGTFLDASVAIWTTGGRAPALLAEAGLACDDRGRIRVDATLRSISHVFVFAAGDCASIDTSPRSEIRQAGIGELLAENLRRAARGGSPQRWRPRRDGLEILDFGNGRAVAWRNGIALKGRRIWQLRDRIDRNWMRMYSEFDLAPDQEVTRHGSGAGFSTDVLNAMLSSVDRARLPNLLDAPDDAALLSPPLGKLLVQSAGFLSAIADDPYLFGQIAASHALSAIYAMGASPWTALALAATSDAHSRKMVAELAVMVRGAQDVLLADGCAMIGGQSAEAAETILGFAVTGLVDSGKVLRRAGLKPGDRLILTKPIGTGLILAAHMRAQARATWLQAAHASMRATNAAACRIIMAHRPSAGTHVSGFGLARHLEEMLTASQVAAVLRVEDIPLLPGVRALAAHGIESWPGPANRAAMPGFGGTDAVLLADPQTSGGLLAGLPAARAEACLQALIDAGVPAALIGDIEQPRAGASGIRLE